MQKDITLDTIYKMVNNKNISEIQNAGAVCLREIQKNEIEMSKTKYQMLAIFDNGEPVATDDFRECFLDSTRFLAFISKINRPGEPCSALIPSLKAYPDADYFVLSINDLQAWQICYNNHWLDWCDETVRFDASHKNPLRFALMHPGITNPDIFDFLFNSFPKTFLSDMFAHCANIHGAKWLQDPDHPADKNYKGYKYSLKEYMEIFGK